MCVLEITINSNAYKTQPRHFVLGGFRSEGFSFRELLRFTGNNHVTVLDQRRIIQFPYLYFCPTSHPPAFSALSYIADFQDDCFLPKPDVKAA